MNNSEHFKRYGEVSVLMGKRSREFESLFWDEGDHSTCVKKYSTMDYKKNKEKILSEAYKLWDLQYIAICDGPVLDRAFINKRNTFMEMKRYYRGFDHVTSNIRIHTAADRWDFTTKIEILQSLKEQGFFRFRKLERKLSIITRIIEKQFKKSWWAEREENIRDSVMLEYFPVAKKYVNSNGYVSYWLPEEAKKYADLKEC